MESLEHPGAFDNGLKAHPETTAFFHAASSVIMHFTDQEKETLLPAWRAPRMLSMTSTITANVKRFVLTSSYIANVNFSDPPSTATEETWNVLKWEDAIANPSFASPASKTYAEKASWDFVEKEKEQISLTTANPAYVLFS